MKHIHVRKYRSRFVDAHEVFAVSTDCQAGVNELYINYIKHTGSSIPTDMPSNSMLCQGSGIRFVVNKTLFFDKYREVK